MVTWLIKCMNTVSPYDLIEREVAADSAADAMAISDFENDEYGLFPLYKVKLCVQVMT